MAFHVNYSRLDRFLHRVAFVSPAVQLTAADVEKAVYSSVYRRVAARRPVFITSLPRAGTTVLLEAFSKLSPVATHLYRDMPFVLAPLVWTRFSSGFRARAELRERAHGDGVLVSEDSPEAFEEVLWRTFWPGKYSAGRIPLWTVEDWSEEARIFFVDHMRKIIALRRPERGADARYVSKNNTNIARLALLPRMFPDAAIVVPVRHPLAHARSLLRQHRNFLAMHHDEPFVRRYMRDVGHYEFGELHRPIAFPGLDEVTAGRSPLTLEYWLCYWIAAFEYVLAHRAAVICVSYEELCGSPHRTLTWLFRQLDIDDEGAIGAVAGGFRSPRPAAGSDEPVDRVLLDRATRLRAELQRVTQPG